MPTAISLLGLVVAINVCALLIMLWTLTTVVRHGLAEIAAAIRARAPDLHVQLRDVPPGPEAHALAARLRLEADRMGDVDHPQGWAAGDDQTVALLREAADRLEGKP